MIKLHASYGLKVPGEQEFSSQSFHATAEIELADALVNQPEAIRAALHSLWSDLKKAVAEELGSDRTSFDRSNSNGHDDANGRTGTSSNRMPIDRIGPNGNGAPASKKQVGFLLSLARRHRGMSAEQTRKWVQSSHGLSLDHLSKSQAGQIIDQLQSK